MRRESWRAQDIKQSITNIRELLADVTFDRMYQSPSIRAAFERFLEILSEAARHIPQDWRDDFGPDIEWRKVSDLGNHIRHAYHKLDVEILWTIYEDNLDDIEAAVDRMIEAYPIDDDDKPRD